MVDIINCSFDAPDGTLLPDYNNSNDIGASFTLLTNFTGAGPPEIASGMLTSRTDNWDYYKLSGIPPHKNYTVKFTIYPSGYNDAPNWQIPMAGVFGRCVNNTVGPGIVIQYWGFGGDINNAVLDIGNNNRFWFNMPNSPISCQLIFNNDTLSVKIYRWSDGQWLVPDINDAATLIWQTDEAIAAAQDVTSFPDAGTVAIILSAGNTD